MREILFRGKRVGRGEWVVGTYLGDYFLDGRLFCIRNDSCNYSVAPSTVGQYTGLTDKNGVKIFEGDIVCANIPKKGGIEGFEVGVVEFHKSAFSAVWSDFLTYGRNFIGYISDIEVIGNIHDTPELLEKKEDKHEAD